MNIQPCSLYSQTANTINKKPLENTNRGVTSMPIIRSKFYYIPHNPIFFEALKKSKFNEMDLACVEKFKAPIEKFNTNNDLQNWSVAQINKDYINKDFGGRQEETKIVRKAMLNDWSSYLTGDESGYKPATVLLIMRAITKDLKETNDSLPPVLNKKVLAETISGINLDLRKKKIQSFDINKIYRHNLINFYAEDNSKTKWVKIPSLANDPQHFESNVQKLKMLSYKTWCTKNTKARVYLEEGDFHIYLEKGEPKLCIRFIGDNVKELQGERNNGMVPCKYSNEADKYFQKKLLINTEFTAKIEQAKDAKTEFLKLRKKYKKPKTETKFSIFLNKIGINTRKKIDPISTFAEFGIEPQKLPDGTLSISEYKQPSIYYTYADIGIDENELFKNVSEIKGNAIFRNTALKSLGKLENIHGNATFANSNLEDLGELKAIHGNAKFVRTNLKTLNKVEYIGGNLGILGSDLNNLGELKVIKGSALFKESKVESLKNVEYIGKSVSFVNDKMNNLGNLKKVGSDVLISNGHKLTPEDFENIEIRGKVKIDTIH